jgi:hypothetical protein
MRLALIAALVAAFLTAAITASPYLRRSDLSILSHARAADAVLTR